MKQLTKKNVVDGAKIYGYENDAVPGKYEWWYVGYGYNCQGVKRQVWVCDNALEGYDDDCTFGTVDFR